jgi:hypothetical protein
MGALYAKNVRQQYAKVYVTGVNHGAQAALTTDEAVP